MNLITCSKIVQLFCSNHKYVPLKLDTWNKTFTSFTSYNNISVGLSFHGDLCTSIVLKDTNQDSISGEVELGIMWKNGGNFSKLSTEECAINTCVLFDDFSFNKKKNLVDPEFTYNDEISEIIKERMLTEEEHFQYSLLMNLPSYEECLALWETTKYCSVLPYSFSVFFDALDMFGLDDDSTIKVIEDIFQKIRELPRC